MSQHRGSTYSEYENLFEVKWTFDPLKALLKKISDQQNSLDIEIKLIKDTLKTKANNKDMDETNIRVARVFNSTEKQIEKLSGNIKYMEKQNYEFKKNVDVIVETQKGTIEYSRRLINELEHKWWRIDSNISQQKLEFENFRNHEEIQKLNYVTKKDEGEEEVRSLSQI